MLHSQPALLAEMADVESCPRLQSLRYFATLGSSALGRDVARSQDNDRTKKQAGRIREASPFFTKAFIKRVGM